METREQARTTIHTELTGDDAEVRAHFRTHFNADIESLCDSMALAVLEWRKIDAIVKADERRAHVSALVYAAITLHIASFKLFLAGHIVAAGNQFRQVVETIALALLCSGHALPILDQFMLDRYSPSKAVRDLQRHWKVLGLKEDAIAPLNATQDFYHSYSHITRLTLATTISFSQDGTYVGVSFDPGKLGAYRKEVSGRVSLARVFPNFVAAVHANLRKWPPRTK